MHHFTLNGGGRAGGQGGARVCWGPWATGRREGSRSRPFWRRGNSIHYSTRRRRPSTAGARVLGLRNTPAHRPYRPASPLLSLTRSGSSSRAAAAAATAGGPTRPDTGRPCRYLYWGTRARGAIAMHVPGMLHCNTCSRERLSAMTQLARQGPAGGALFAALRGARNDAVMLRRPVTMVAWLAA